MLRGLAAVEVVCFHLRGTFFVDRSPGSGAMLWLFYFLTSLGHQAVMVFFVLS
jgi:peptidoglycan/LPS O-acetylase OafA/YrhL